MYEWEIGGRGPKNNTIGPRYGEYFTDLVTLVANCNVYMQLPGPSLHKSTSDNCPCRKLLFLYFLKLFS